MLEEELHKRVIGQDNAIEAALMPFDDQGQAYRMRMSHRFFFLSTGVGKTELAAR